MSHFTCILCAEDMCYMPGMYGHQSCKGSLVFSPLCVFCFFLVPLLQIWCILSTTNIIFCMNIPYILCTLGTCMPYIPCNVHSEYSKYFLCMCNILSKLIQNAICHIALPRIITIVSLIPIIIENIEKSQGSQFWSKFYKLYLTYHINWHKSIPCFTSFSPLGIK